MFYKVSTFYYGSDKTTYLLVPLAVSFSSLNLPTLCTVDAIDC